MRPSAYAWTVAEALELVHREEFFLNEFEGTQGGIHLVPTPSQKSGHCVSSVWTLMTRVITNFVVWSVAYPLVGLAGHLLQFNAPVCICLDSGRGP